MSLAATAAACLLLSACSNDQVREGPTLTTDAALTYDSNADYAGVFGRVGTEQADGALCVYVDSTQGIAHGRVNLIFPAGYSATPGGAVQDRSGAVVARVGQRVAISVGPVLADQQPVGCSSSGVGTATALHIDPA